ncbi:amidohydrolase family protein [Fusibacter paucivorans]|uniref:Amidohydrolase family protein n=1 Tax=Fusibacter paucivorans TaxID=76009 RepID=A0ABS5PNA8_9FIRM|nr:amidohydrolase family protein [Fusibacter paucivorans]MBS7526392.1 amidohydrolase family protein [Fusibacter paucivorans]
MMIINNVTILSMKDDRLTAGQYVKIENETIRAIQSSPFAETGDVEIVDGTDQYLMPGLINMHTHLGDNPDDLQLYLVNGVTTIRNMWGYGRFKPMNWIMGTRVFDHLTLKRQIENAEVVGPDIITAGALLDGNPPVFPKYMYLHALSDREQTRRIIERQALQGYDFIKIYHALSRQQFDEIMIYAGQYNMRVAGHVPDDVGVMHALDSKMWTMEHLYGFINPYRPDLNPDMETVKVLSHQAAEKKVWQCPTLVANERLANTAMQKTYERERSFQYVSKRQRKGMRFLQKASEQLYEKKGIPGNHVYMDDYKAIVELLRRAGAGILVGTDKAVPYVVAGFSEHREMALLQDAGLSRYEVIRAATADAAKCLGLSDSLGTVEVGKRANLILTTSNPLDDLNAIQMHTGVFKAGVFYSRTECDAMLSKIQSAI